MPRAQFEGNFPDDASDTMYRPGRGSIVPRRLKDKNFS
jgi:hypothetical protein